MSDLPDIGNLTAQVGYSGLTCVAASRRMAMSSVCVVAGLNGSKHPQNVRFRGETLWTSVDLQSQFFDERAPSANVVSNELSHFLRRGICVGSKAGFIQHFLECGIRRRRPRGFADLIDDCLWRPPRGKHTKEYE